MHFLEMKLSKGHFDPNLTEKFIPKDQLDNSQVSTGSGNDLAPNRWQSLT